MDKFPGIKRREYFHEDREATLESMTGPQLKAISELTKIFEDSSLRHSRAGTPYIFLSLPSEKSAEETDEMLRMVGIHSWMEGTDLTIEYTGEVYKMQLMGIVNDPLNEIQLEDSFPMKYKSIPDVFKKDDTPSINSFGSEQEATTLQSEEDDLSSDVRKVGRGEILAGESEHLRGKIWHGDVSFLAKNSRAYYWKGKRLFSRKEDREISQDEYADVLAKAKSGDRTAREQLLKMNAGLVYFVAFNFSRFKPNVNQADLIQEGLIAMDAAIDNFDPSREGKFSTYVVLCMEGAMHRFYREHKSDIRVPSHGFDTASQIKKAERLELLGGKADLQTRVAIRLGISEEKLREAQEFYSTDRAYVDTAEAHEFVDENETEKALKEYFENQTSEEIKKSFARLTQREKTVLVLRFGLDPDFFLRGEKTVGDSSSDIFTQVTKHFGDRVFTPEYQVKGIFLEEVGKYLDVGRERVRQIEAKALRRLRHPDIIGSLRSVMSDSED